MRFAIPLGVPELLIKAEVKTAKVTVNLGSWAGLKIIAIGPKGGKIVGYGAGHKPIYAGSKQGKSLAKIHQHAQHPSGLQTQQEDVQSQSVLEWLLSLGFPAKAEGNHVAVSPESGELLASHFGVTPLSQKPTAWGFKLSQLVPHAGKPLTPKADEHAGWAASIAAGDDEHDPFPDLGKLKEIPAGMFAGSHGNKLFETPDGKKWVFKSEDPTIARAEEAAARIGRLILGNRIPATKHVTVNGKSGALIQVIPGTPLNKNHGESANMNQLGKYADQVAEHFVVDWLTSNHDGHSGNFLAAGDHLNAIDKGQAWKFFGKDKLEPGYKPNPSPTVYNKFWKAVSDGMFSSEATAKLMEALEKAVAKAETITPDQFKLIVGPYVGTAAAHMGFDADARLKAMAKRLETLRADMEEFASGVMGSPWKMAKQKSADNFETMPEVEAKEKGKPKLVIQNPDKPPTIVGGPKQPVVTSPAPGWPVTKKDTTIHHPGSPPPPTAKWAGGLPGIGFSLQTKYKGKNYTLEIGLNDAGNGPKLTVFYPDGSSKHFDSLNKAGDSLYLFENGMPLDMSATEKKAKKVGLGSKAWKLDAFKAELESAHGGEESPGAMTPAELEAEKVVPKGAEEVSVDGLLQKQSPGVVTDWGILPYQAQLKLHEAADKTYGSNYHGAPPPGTAVLHVYDNKPRVFVSNVNSLGQATYNVFWVMDGKWIEQPMAVAYANDNYGIDLMPSVKWLIVAPQIPESLKKPEPAGPPPAAQLPEDAVVQKVTTKKVAAVMAPGTTLTVQKKFPHGKMDVKLTALDEGKFKTEWEDQTGAITYNVHNSLSAASDFVWVNQQGHPGVNAYKAATGKKKIASGGGWKFWGVTPVPDAPEPSPPAEKPAASASPTAKLPTLYETVNAKVGTKYLFGHGVWEKKAGGTWVNDDLTVGSEEMQQWVEAEEAESPHFKVITVGGSILPPSMKKPSKENFETMPDAYIAAAASTDTSWWDDVPVGTKIYFAPEDAISHVSVWKKKSDGKWVLTQSIIGTPSSADVVDAAKMMEWVKEKKQKGKKVGIVVAAPYVPTTESALLNDFAPGGGIKFTSHGMAYTARRVATNDGWEWQTDEVQKYTPISAKKLLGLLKDSATTVTSTFAKQQPIVPNWAWFADWDDLSESERSEKLYKMGAGAGLVAEIYPHIVLMHTGVEGVGQVLARKNTDSSWTLVNAKTGEELKGGLLESDVVSLFHDAKSGIQGDALAAKQFGAAATPEPEDSGKKTGFKPSFFGTTQELTHYVDSLPEGTTLTVDGVDYTRKDEADGVWWYKGDKAKFASESFALLVLKDMAGEYVQVTPPTTPPTSAAPVSKPTELSSPIWDVDEQGFPVWADMKPGYPVKLVGVAGQKEKYTDYLANAPTGTSVMMAEGGVVYIYQKGTDGQWYTKEDALSAAWIAGQAKAVGAAPEVWKPSNPAVSPSEGWAGVVPGSVVVLEELPNVPFLVDAPEGASLIARNDGGATMVIQQKGSFWQTADGEMVGSAQAFSKLTAFGMTSASVQVPAAGAAEPDLSNWWFVDGNTPSDEELTAKLEALPVGTVLHAKDSEGTVVWTKLESDKWESDFTHPSTKEPAQITASNKSAAHYMLMDAKSGVVPTLAKAPAPKKSPTLSKLGKAKMIVSPSEIEEAEPNQHANKIFETLEQWKAFNPLYAQKPTGWDSWVPPPGVLFKAEKDGQSYYLTVSVTGHKSDDTPGPNVGFAIIHPGGVSSGKSMKSAAAALKYVAQKAGLGIDNVKELKKLWGLDKAIFSAGESFWTLKDGTGPSALPYADDVLEKPIEEMSAAEKMQTVKKDVPLSAALKLKHPNLLVKAVKGKPELTNICANKDVSLAPDAALMALAKQYGFETTIINTGGKPKKNTWGGAYMTIPTSILEQEVTIEVDALAAAGVAPVVKTKKPEPKAKVAPPPDPVKEALKAKAKAVGEWAGKNKSVTNTDSLEVLAHFQEHVRSENEEIGIWARATEAGSLLLGSEHADFATLIHGLGLDAHPVETPLGTFYEMTTAELASATPGQPALGSVTGPDGKQYPKGTTFKEKVVEHTIEKLLEQEDGFYKYKPHNTDPNTVVVKATGNGETQKQQLEAMLTKYAVPFSGIISGGSNTLAFVQKADLAKIGKTETLVEAKTPKQPPAFAPAPLPLLGSGGVMWSEVKSTPSAEFAAMPATKLSPFGKVVVLGKPGVLRDFQVSVRRVKAKNGKIYHEVSGQLANYAPGAGKLVAGTVVIRTGATKKSAGSMTLNYNEQHGYTDESGDHAGNITTDHGYSGETDAGSSIEVHKGGNVTFDNVFRVRIPEGQDIESELSQAFQKMGYEPDALSQLDEDSERTWKKWSIVRSLMGAKGWNTALKDPEKIHNEKWLNKQLKKYEAEHLVAQATIRQTFDGHAAVVLQDGEKFKDGGWKFAHRADRDADSLFFQIAAGVGWSSRKTKYLNGAYSSGWSPSQDLNNGGATGAFFRVNYSTSDIGKHAVVVHPRVFERTDWWRYNSDNYGNIAGSGSGNLSASQERYETALGGSSNEIMFAGGVSLADVVCVTVGHDGEKNDLIKKLKGVGVEQVNGVSLEDFILVGGHNVWERVHPSLKT